VVHVAKSHSENVKGSDCLGDLGIYGKKRHLKSVAGRIGWSRAAVTEDFRGFLSPSQILG
jgi:hypothetical protein